MFYLIVIIGFIITFYCFYEIYKYIKVTTPFNANKHVKSSPFKNRESLSDEVNFYLALNHLISDLSQNHQDEIYEKLVKQNASWSEQLVNKNLSFAMYRRYSDLENDFLPNRIKEKEVEEFADYLGEMVSHFEGRGAVH